MLIAAAYHLGFLVVPTHRGASDAYLNFSMRSLQALEDGAKTPMPRPADDEPFRVLGQDRGTIYYAPAGTAPLVALRSAAHTPANLLRLAPIDYWTTRFPPRNKRDKFDSIEAAIALFKDAGEAGIIDPPPHWRRPRA